MKVFIPLNDIKGYISDFKYNWCNPDEILMFGQFVSSDTKSPKDVYLTGIETRKCTTHFTVKDLNISFQFLKELLTNSIEKAWKTSVSENGDYNIQLSTNCGQLVNMPFNINNDIQELLIKASRFKEGEVLVCLGRTILKENYSYEQV